VRLIDLLRKCFFFFSAYRCIRERDRVHSEREIGKHARKPTDQWRDGSLESHQARNCQATYFSITNPKCKESGEVCCSLIMVKISSLGWKINVRWRRDHPSCFFLQSYLLTWHMLRDIRITFQMRGHFREASIWGRGEKTRDRTKKRWRHLSVLSKIYPWLCQETEHFWV